LEAVFCVRSVLRLYNGDRLPLRDTSVTAVTRVIDWCEIAASLGGREPGDRGSSAVGRRYRAEQ
jgi:hypothetical protein